MHSYMLAHFNTCLHISVNNYRLLVTFNNSSFHSCIHMYTYTYIYTFVSWVRISSLHMYTDTYI